MHCTFSKFIPPVMPFSRVCAFFVIQIFFLMDYLKRMFDELLRTWRKKLKHLKTDANSRKDEESQIAKWFGKSEKCLSHHAITIQRCYRGHRGRQALKIELLALFSNHAEELDAIELQMRRGVEVCGKVTYSNEDQFWTKCDMVLTGTTKFASLSFFKVENKRRMKPSSLDHTSRYADAFLNIMLKDIVAIYFCKTQPFSGANSGERFSLYSPFTDVITTSEDTFDYIYSSNNNFTIIFCGNVTSRIQIECETGCRCKDLVHALRLLIERNLSAQELEQRGRKSWLLLPLKAIYKSTLSEREYLNAMKTLLDMSEISVIFYSDFSASKHQKNSFALDCFWWECSKNESKTGKVLNSNKMGKRGRIVMKNNLRGHNDDKNSMHLIFEVSSAWGLASQTGSKIDVSDIIEVRRGRDVCFLRTLESVDSECAVTIVSRQASVAFEVESTHKLQDFVASCRAIATYSYQQGGNFNK